ncbi:MAG: DUF3306 domain-containing protein [Pseudomonadota bacterium]
MSDDDFLSRWSRRKRLVADEEAANEGAAGPVVEPEAEPETEEEEQALLARLDLPVPESLKPGDDFSPFMADGVPQFLRKRALRVLWRSNPVLANLDGLNDYDEDFNAPELTQKVLATAYQVGRGIVSQVTEPDDREPEDITEEVAEVSVEKTDEPVISPVKQTPADTVVHNDEPEPSPRPRRMRFES